MQSLREELFSLAQAWREQNPHVQVCAITGSSGKTSTKEVLAKALKYFGKTVASLENYNTKPALAGDIFKFKAETQYGVFELGLRQPGDLTIPLKFIQPQVVACLNVSQAHLEFFRDEDHLLEEKCKIFSASDKTHSVIVPDNDPRILSWAKKSGRKIFSFGQSSSADFRIQSYRFILDEQSTEVEMAHQQNLFKFTLPGCHSKKSEQLAVALAFCHALGLDIRKLPKNFAQASFVPRRFEIQQKNNLFFVDDSFNANPDSMKSSLDTLFNIWSTKKKLIVLGSMLELGPVSHQKHQEIQKYLQKKIGGGDLLLQIGDEWMSEESTSIASFFANTESAREFISKNLKPEAFDVVFVKGSKAHKLDTLRDLF